MLWIRDIHLHGISIGNLFGALEEGTLVQELQTVASVVRCVLGPHSKIVVALG